MVKKEPEDHEVKVRMVDGSNVIFGPYTKKEAEATAKEFCDAGCNKDGTYYPVYQIIWAKVYPINV